MRLWDRIRWMAAEVGARVRGISVMVDLVAGCTFSCPSCPVGNMDKSRKGYMMPDRFMELFDRLQRQARIRYVLLYSFSEPFLNPMTAWAVGELKRRGIRRVMISTNLSLPAGIERAMAAGLDELRISFSGWKNGEYFHRGRDMAQFEKACRDLSRIAPKYKTRVALIFHVYRSNVDELPRVREFARTHGFDLIEERAFFIPFDKIVSREYSAEDRMLFSHLIETPDEKVARGDYDPICYYQQKQLVIDATGKAFLCRHVWGDEHVVGDVLTESIWEIRHRQATNVFCAMCKARGLNKYTEQA